MMNEAGNEILEQAHLDWQAPIAVCLAGGGGLIPGKVVQGPDGDGDYRVSFQDPEGWLRGLQWFRPSGNAVSSTGHRIVQARHRPSPAAGDLYRHVKRGTVYEVIGTAELQAGQLQGDHAALTIYRGEDGKLWARNTAEFHDGRFVPATPSIESEIAVLEQGRVR